MAETSLDSRVTPPSPPLTPPPHSVSASAAAPGAGDDSAAKRAHQLSSPDILIHGRDTGIQGAVLSVHAHPLASPLLDGTTAAAAARDLELGSPRRGSASGAAISAAAREGAPRMQHRISSGPGRDIYLRDEDSERDPLLEQARLHGAAQLRRLDDNKTLAALRRPLRHRTPWRGATTQAQGEVSSEQEQRAEEEQEQHQQQQREDLERSMRADADKATTLGNKKGLRGFYASQNTMIESLLKSMDDHARDALDEEAENRLPVKIAVVGSFICNCILAILQIYAAASSLSLSFFATASDSVFDPLANGVLYYCHWKAQRVDHRKWPSGGSKFESIGDIVYSSVMLMVSVILIAFSIQALVTAQEDLAFHIPAVVAVGIAFATKLALFLYCFPLRNKSSQVRVLWEDHRNDLAVNGLGIFTNAAGANIVWWIDPAGAIVISCALIYLWASTCKEHFAHLAGLAAPTEFHRLVVYKAVNFAPDDIVQIDSCVVYHAGPNYVVELDVVMAAETPLWRSHDISQALQDKLERLPKVDRAFVHVDHETDHRPEHRKST